MSKVEGPNGIVLDVPLGAPAFESVQSASTNRKPRIRVESKEWPEGSSWMLDSRADVKPWLRAHPRQEFDLTEVMMTDEEYYAIPSGIEPERVQR